MAAPFNVARFASAVAAQYLWEICFGAGFGWLFSLLPLSALAVTVGMSNLLYLLIAVFLPTRFGAIQSWMAIDPGEKEATLGFEYYTGLATENNGMTKGPHFVMARQSWRHGAQGNSIGMANLGVLYELGRGLPSPDFKEAERWYRKASDMGNLHAQHRLGMMLHDGPPGTGVGDRRVDKKEGILLLQMAAKGGYKPTNAG